MLVLICNLTTNALILQFTRKVSCEIGALVSYIMKFNSGQFKNGFEPWCKGTRGLMKSNKTSFKKGQTPWNKGIKGAMEAWNRTNIYIKCCHCEKEFRITNSEQIHGRKYCSNYCRTQSSRGHIPWNKNTKGLQIGWNKGTKGVVKPNKGCFKKGQMSWSKGKKFSDELRKKLSLSHIGILVGPKHPQWKGGLTPLIQKIKNLPEYKEWYREVLKRDKYTCRNCKKYNSPRITAHHLKSFAYLVNSLENKTLDEAKQLKELWNLDNGVALCHPCHQLTPNYSSKAAKNPIDTNLYL